MKKSYDLHLPYFKQGDDLHWQLEHAKGRSKKEKHANALKDHASMLQDAIKILKVLSSLAAEGKIEIENADCHFISVQAEESVGEKLVKKEILAESDWDDEEDLDDEG
jgi:hypothetical protein